MAERAQREPLDGSDRFHSALPIEERARLEAPLISADHPQLWTDAALQERARRFEAEHGRPTTDDY